MRELDTLKGKTRVAFGTGASREARRTGFTIGVIYGNKKDNIHVELDSMSLVKVYDKGYFTSKTVEIDLGDKKIKVVPKRVDLDPVTEKIMHIDFIYLDDKIQVLDVPIKFLNVEKSIGVKRGAFFNIATRKIKIECSNTSDIPTFLEFDVSDLVTGIKVKASEIKLLDCCKLLTDPERVVASMIGKKSNADAEESSSAPEATTDKKPETKKAETKKPETKKR